MLRELLHCIAQLYSIKVTRSGKVKRAKLYYLRDRTGKSARIAEKIKKKIGIDVETKPEQVTDENVAKSNDNIKEEEISSEKNLALEPEAKKKDIKENRKFFEKNNFFLNA